MKKKFFAVAMAALLLALGGCGDNGHGVGVGTGTSEAAGAATSTLIARIKSLAHSFTAKATIQIPASALIADTFRDYSELNGSRFIAPLTRIPGTAVDKAQERSEHTHFLSILALSVKPFNGWEVNALAEKKAEKEGLKNWLESLEVQVLFANTVCTEIASMLKDDVLSDPESAKNAVLNAFYSIPNNRLWDAWEQANAAAKAGHREIDLSGNEAVHWVKGSQDFVGDRRGLVLTQNGVTWYGDGKLSGKAWEFGLENSTAKTLSKQQDIKEGVEQATGGKTEAGASVK